MEYNWKALELVILKEDISINRALMAMGLVKDIKSKGRRRKQKYTDEQIKQMIKLKENMSWREVGEELNITASMAQSAVKIYKENKKKKPQCLLE